MRRLTLLKIGNPRGQASAELAIMGAIVLMLMGYLFVQGATQNYRQALEMYTFRKALQLSQADKIENRKGISLTVVRDVMMPSFFSGISRQRMMSSSSVDTNVWMAYSPEADSPQDIGSRQLLQVGDAMIERDYFVEIPPTKVNVTRTGAPGNWTWVPSSVEELDSQIGIIERATEQTVNTRVTNSNDKKRLTKTMSAKEYIPMVTTFSNGTILKDNYHRDDWENNITKVEVDENTIPSNLHLVTDETVERQKDVELSR